MIQFAVLRVADEIGNGTACVGQHRHSHGRDTEAGGHVDCGTVRLFTRITVVPVVVQGGLHLDLGTDLRTGMIRRRALLQDIAQIHCSVIPVASRTQLATGRLVAVLVATVVRAVVAFNLLLSRLRNIGICGEGD